MDYVYFVTANAVSKPVTEAYVTNISRQVPEEKAHDFTIDWRNSDGMVI